LELGLGLGWVGVGVGVGVCPALLGLGSGVRGGSPSLPLPAEGAPGRAPGGSQASNWVGVASAERRAAARMGSPPPYVRER